MDSAMINSLLSVDARIRMRGRLHSSLSYVSITSTANTLVLSAPTGGTMYLYAVEVFNRNSTDMYLLVGTGSSLTQRLPRLGPFLTNFHDVVWLPLHEFETDIYMTSTAGAASPNDVQVKAYTIAVSG